MELQEMSWTAMASPAASLEDALAPVSTAAATPAAAPPAPEAPQHNGQPHPQGLRAQPWVQDIVGATSARVVFDSCGADPSSSKNLSVDLSADHLFLSLLDHHLIHDMLVVYNPATRQLHNALRFGVPVCGHPKIVHGGLTSAILDETFGALLYSMRREGQASFHRVFTARLEVDYKAPLPAESTVVCRAAVQSFEGRKLWLDAEVADPDSGLVYARSKSLFVIPRGDAGAAAAEAANGSAGAANGTPMAKSGDVAETAAS